MATLLPLPETTWFDQNGIPLAGGSVYFYVPNTTTPKDTYQDAAGTVLNTNPITLDSAGRAIVYGTGSYRQEVYDAAGNLIWDQVTADTAVGGLAWGGVSTGTPNAQVIAASSFSQQDGQQISFIVGAGLTNTGSTTIAPGGGNGIAVLRDTLAGPSTLTGNELIAGNAVTLVYDATRGAFHLVQNDNFPTSGDGKIIFYSAPEPGWLECNGAELSRTTYAPLFAKIGTTYGAGDGSTTFNIPDMRGYFPRGWSHGSSIDSGRTFGSSQTDAFESHTHTAAVTDPGHTHTAELWHTTGTDTAHFSAYATTTDFGLTATTNSSTTGITVANSSTGGTETRPDNVAIMFVIKT